MSSWIVIIVEYFQSLYTVYLVLYSDWSEACMGWEEGSSYFSLHRVWLALEHALPVSKPFSYIDGSPSPSCLVHGTHVFAMRHWQGQGGRCSPSGHMVQELDNKRFDNKSKSICVALSVSKLVAFTCVYLGLRLHAHIFNVRLQCYFWLWVCTLQIETLASVCE